MKFAIISPVLPPSPSGQAVVLYHLLRNLPPENYIAISTRNYSKGSRNDCTDNIGGMYHYLPGLNIVFKKFLLVMNFFRITLFLRAYLEKRVRQYEKILRSNGCELAIGCTADIFEPYAVLHACTHLLIPFYFYILDDYRNQWTDRFEAAFLQEFGPDIIKGADKVIVINECLKKGYDTEFGIHTVLLHNPTDLQKYPPPAPLSSGKGIGIFYTGDVGEAHYDAFRNLIAALERIGDSSIKIHIYTGRRRARLLKEGITGPYVILHEHQHISSIPHIQQSADILFLPLAFHSRYPEFIINSASPGKMGEFLASGRPILVHAPSGSFVSWYFKKNRCGFVVDSPSIDTLATGILRLVRDGELREKISSAARESAFRDFNAESIQVQFEELVNADPPPASLLGHPA